MPELFLFTTDRRYSPCETLIIGAASAVVARAKLKEYLETHPDMYEYEYWGIPTTLGRVGDGIFTIDLDAV